MAEEGVKPEMTKKEKVFFENFQEYTGYKRSIFMIGITGAGKSTFCNFLANKKVFDEACGFASMTQQAGAYKFNFNAEDVLIIDCPGFCDSKRPPEDISDELCKVGVIAKDGTDAVAIVVNSMERFSDNHRSVLNQLEFLGGSLWDHAFLVFTRESKVMKEFGVTEGAQYIELMSQSKDCPPVLKEWLSKTKRRFLCVESKKKFQNEAYRNEKCTKIFSLIDQIRKDTKNVRYNNSIMKQGAKFFKQLSQARRTQEGMQKLAVQMEQQRQDDKKALGAAQRKLEEAQRDATEKNERDMQRIQDAQEQINEMNRKNEEMMERHHQEQELLRTRYELEQREKDIEIAELRAKSNQYVKSSSGGSCFSHQTKIQLATGELINISYIKSGDILHTPNGPRKVAVLSMIKRYTDRVYTIDSHDFQFNMYHPFVVFPKNDEESTSFAVVDVSGFINFMPPMAARKIQSLYARDTILSGFSKDGLCPIPIQSISKSEGELPTEYDILYDIILEPNGTGINEYFAGDDEQLFLVSSELSMYTLHAELQYIPAYITILSMMNKAPQQQTVYSSDKLNTENDVIRFFEKEVVQDGINLLTDASFEMSHFKSLNLTHTPITIYEIEKYLKQTLSFFANPKPISVTTLSLIYEYLQTLIGPIHTMIKLGWREYVRAEKRDQLAVGVADVAFIGEECFSEPIEILLMTNNEQVPVIMQEKRGNTNPRIRSVVDTVYIPFNEAQDDKLYLIVKEKNSEKLLAKKRIKLEPDSVYDYRLLRLFSYDNVSISEVRVNLDMRVVSNEQMEREVVAREDWKEEFEVHFAEIFASKIIDGLVEKVKAL